MQTVDCRTLVSLVHPEGQITDFSSSFNFKVTVKAKSPRLSADECIAAQQAIDAQIEEIASPSSESGRELRARRNAYTLINVWLPVELMVAIFYEAMLASRFTPYYIRAFEGYSPSPEWITTITHVCHNWRTIAIGSPRLWEGISFVISEITSIMLERSKAAPISISYRSWSDLDQPINTLPLALSHSDRAFEISLNMPSREIRDLVSKHLTKPMPFLKRLELWTSGLPAEDVPCFLPPRCLEGTSCLNRLILLAVGFSRNSILPATLIKLSLYHPPEKFTVSQMVTLLEPLENLSELLIEDALRSDTPDSSSSLDPRLSPRACLSRLHLGAGARQRNDFMRRFPITSTTQVTFPCRPEVLEDFRFGQLLRPVYGARRLLRGLCVSYTGRVCINAYLDASLPAMPSEMCFNLLVMPWADSNFPWQETLRDSCAQIPLDRVETLDLNSTRSNEELGEVTAQLLASHLPGVRALSARGQAVKHILRVLHTQADGNDPAFPCLRTLKVDNRYSSETEKQQLRSIADCLVARKGSGKAADVEEFTFNDRVVPPEHLQDPESLKRWELPSVPDLFMYGLGPEILPNTREHPRWPRPRFP